MPLSLTYFVVGLALGFALACWGVAWIAGRGRL